MSPYVRTVKTASGARAVQIVHSSRRGSRDIEHIGSAHDDAELELLKAVARQRLVGGQDELDLGLQSAEPTGRGPLPITSSRMGHLWDALSHAYEVVGFDRAAGGDEVFRQLVLARIIEPTSKLDSSRVLEEVGADPPIYRTPTRRLPVFAKDSWRQKIATACAARPRPGPAGPGAAGALRRVDPVLADRCRGRVPRTGVVQGTTVGAADHHRPVDRRVGVPLDGQRLRG